MNVHDSEEFELGTDGPRVILVGVDGSPTSFRAAAYAAGLARRQHARLVAVYVHQPPIAAVLAAPTGAAVTLAAREAGQEIEADLREALHRYARTWGVDGYLVVGAGDPATVLTDVATEVNADGIIVGSSASVARRITGSVATLSSEPAAGRSPSFRDSALIRRKAPRPCHDPTRHRGRAGDDRRRQGRRLLHRQIAPRLHLVRGLRARVLDGTTPPLRRSRYVQRRLRPRQLAGTLCPNLSLGACRIDAAPRTLRPRPPPRLRPLTSRLAFRDAAWQLSSPTQAHP